LPEAEGFIDFANFGMTLPEVRSVAAVASYWRSAAREAGMAAGLAADPEALETLVDLADGLPDAAWQRRWLRTWDRLIDSGQSVGDLFRLVFAAAGQAEAALLASPTQVRPVHFDLSFALRRGVVAACCGAIEVRDEIRNIRSGISGEVTALHALQSWSTQNKRVAILSLSLVSRDIRSHFSASELQELPALIVDRLQNVLRPEDMIFAGRENEWLLLLPDVNSKVQPSLAAAKIERAFVDPLRLARGRPISLAVAIGAALLPEHGREPSAAVQSARLARWAGKAKGEAFSWFQAEQGQDWRQYSAMVEELRSAIELEHLELHLQPQVDLASNRCTGAELLLRWQRQDGEWVPPPQIVEMVEQNGWRPLLTDWLIRAAIRAAAELEEAGIRIHLSLNLVAGDLLDIELPDIFAQRLAAWDMCGERFIVELTESAMMGNRELSLAVIERLRAQGFRISLDDFGTGYSSLSYLVSLPIYELKVDRSFVVAMFDSEENMRIVRTIIDLANDLGMVPLAEGVDDPRQLEQLRQLGCKMVQGYLYAKPMPIEEFIAWCTRKRA